MWYNVWDCTILRLHNLEIAKHLDCTICLLYVAQYWCFIVVWLHNLEITQSLRFHNLWDYTNLWDFQIFEICIRLYFEIAQSWYLVNIEILQPLILHNLWDCTIFDSLRLHNHWDCTILRLYKVEIAQYWDCTISGLQNVEMWAHTPHEIRTKSSLNPHGE